MNDLAVYAIYIWLNRAHQNTQVGLERFVRCRCLVLVVGSDLIHLADMQITRSIDLPSQATIQRTYQWHVDEETFLYQRRDG